MTDIQEAARELPLDKILVETMRPYLAPVPNAVKTKTATRYVVDFIADLRGMTTEELAVARLQMQSVFLIDSMKEKSVEGRDDTSQSQITLM